MADKRNDLPSEINHRWTGRALSTGRIASNALRLAGRRLIRAKGDGDRVLGQNLARELDQMKGLAMKVGQILSYFDGILPEETHDALHSLQQGAKPVAFATIARVIESAFDAPIARLFDEFDSQPVAAASIGQVHRARLDGRDVAVKVQYPNVRKTFETDTKRLRSLSKLASLATAVDGPAIVDELRIRILEECDYQREAGFQRAFQTAFSTHADDRKDICIPEPVMSRTRTTVLTTGWEAGRDFYSFIQSSAAQQRNRVGRIIMRFAYQSLFNFGIINADPHPGNYLFPDDGPVVFLDFGCVRRFDSAFLEAERRLAQVILDDRRDRFPDAVLATGMVAKPKRFSFDHHWDMLCHQYAPYRQARFQFTAEYIRDGLRYTGPSNPNLRRLAIPPAWIWTQRLQWGLHAVLARLQAQGDFRDILKQALDTPLRPFPSVPSQSVDADTDANTDMTTDADTRI